LRAFVFVIFSVAGSENTCILKQSVQSHPRSLTFGTNRKRLCDFLLVRHCNIDPILPRFRDTVGFMFRKWPHSDSIRILGCFRWTRAPSQLYQREIIFRGIPTYVITVPQRYRQKDIYDLSSRNSALRSIPYDA